MVRHWHVFPFRDRVPYVAEISVTVMLAIFCAWVCWPLVIPCGWLYWRADCRYDTEWRRRCSAWGLDPNRVP